MTSAPSPADPDSKLYQAVTVQSPGPSRHHQAPSLTGPITLVPAPVPVISSQVDDSHSRTLNLDPTRQGLPSPWPQTGSSSYGQSSQLNSQHFSLDWLQSLRLMHHYCTSTCLELPGETPTHELWRSAIPEAACSYVGDSIGSIVCYVSMLTFFCRNS